MNTMFSTHALRLAYGKTLMDDGSSLITSDGYTYEATSWGLHGGWTGGRNQNPFGYLRFNSLSLCVVAVCKTKFGSLSKLTPQLHTP